MGIAQPVPLFVDYNETNSWNVFQCIATAVDVERMLLMIGKTLGHYRVGEQLGRGGMGEVYVADDLNLSRKVALKFLPDAFGGDPERMARFEREAKLLASLNHPNIAAIYGLEQAEGKRFLVLELVEGETLAQRLSKGPLPIEEALGVCRQIADGLEAAHEKGVIHRDLKPANVMITEGDKVKILDFGLAKALSDETQSVDSSQSPTLTEAMTRPGVILGTAAYMSPEQAKGKTVDKRADIWAFGCILYECLTGKRAFEGETVTETLAAVLTRDPEWEKIPAKVRPLLRRCLERDPKKRLRDIGDANALLESAPGDSPESVPAKRRWLAWGIAIPAVLVAVALALVHFREKPTAVQSMRLQINLPDKVSLSGTGDFALSPDGHHLAFTAVGSDGVQRLWLRALDSLESRPLLGTESGSMVIWSPDGRFIAFNAEGKLKKIDVSGGPPRIICDISGGVVGGSWNSHGVIIFGDYGASYGIMQVAATGGIPSALTKPDRANGEEHIFPAFLPDGRHFLYLCNSNIPDKNGLYVGSMDSSPEEQGSKQVLATSSTAAYVPSGQSDSGQLLFLHDQTLMTQQFDDKLLALVSKPIPIAERVGNFWNFGFFSASTNGILVYRSGGMSQLSRVTWINRQGGILGTMGEAGLYSGLALSPDGSRAAVGWQNNTQSLVASDIWLLDFSRDTSTRFTFGKDNDNYPVWSPDGRSIIFQSHQNEGIGNLYQKLAGGANEEKLLLKSNRDKYPTSLSRDGRFLLYTEEGDLYILPMESGSKGMPFLHTEFNERDGRFSPDMRWVAYVSDETGRNEIYVCEIPQASKGALSESGNKYLISKGGGKGPRWRGDGKELYYLAPDGTLMAVQVTADKVFQAATPKPLFKVPAESLTSTAMFGLSNLDVVADGSRFLVTMPISDSMAEPFTVILNWTSLLKK